MCVLPVWFDAEAIKSYEKKLNTGTRVTWRNIAKTRGPTKYEWRHCGRVTRFWKSSQQRPTRGKEWRTLHVPAGHMAFKLVVHILRDYWLKCMIPSVAPTVGLGGPQSHHAHVGDINAGASRWSTIFGKLGLLRYVDLYLRIRFLFRSPEINVDVEYWLEILLFICTSIKNRLPESPCHFI